MERLLILVLIVFATVSGGCLPEGDRTPPRAATVSMARHISNVHSVRIGEDEMSEIIVTETNGLVHVRFDDAFLRRVPGDCLMVLRFTGPQKTFDKSGYLAFLDQLHAYLTLSPMKPEKTAQPRNVP